MMFDQLDAIPDGFLTTEANRLQTLLPKPTLLHLPGKQEPPIFVSVLLHGNEPTGLLAVQRLLNKYRDKPLPRSLSVFIGNVSAAARALRRFENQPDYNRIWPGTELASCPETEMAAAIVAIMRGRGVFVSIDVHNNTGLNPHYACINSLEQPFLQLASLFGRLIVYYLRPKGVQSAAFAKLCPSATLECGKPGQDQGVEHAFRFIDDCLHLNELPALRPTAQKIDLFHTVAQVKIDDAVDFSFRRPDADLFLSGDLDLLNFTEIAPGTSFGKIKNGSGLPLNAFDEHGKNVTDEFFSLQNNDVRIKRATMPSMLTLDERVIRQDCLCYLMERLPL